jgi:hypothetical protein
VSEPWTPGPFSCPHCDEVRSVVKSRWCRVCDAERKREWRRMRTEEAREQRRRERQRPSVKESFQRRRKRRRRENPDKGAAEWARRVAWLREGDVTRAQLHGIYVAARGQCHYCGGGIPFPRFGPTDPRGFDHVLPRAAGGKHTASNIVVACGRCNAEKSAQVAS